MRRDMESSCCLWERDFVCLFAFLLITLSGGVQQGGYGGRWHERDGWMINPLVQKPGRPLFLAKMNVMVVSRVNDKMILPVRKLCNS